MDIPETMKLERLEFVDPGNLQGKNMCSVRGVKPQI